MAPAGDKLHGLARREGFFESPAPRSPGAAPSSAMTVAVHGAKGGVGTTMLAAEMIREFAAAGRSVAAVDADLDRGSLHYRLDTPVGRGTFTIADVASVIDEISAERIASALAGCESGARLLPSPSDPCDRPSLGSAHARKLVDALSAAFDYTVVDTSASQDLFITGLLSASDVVVLVVTPELACLGGARRALAVFDSLPGGRPRTELVVNRAAVARDLVTLRDIETFLGVKAAAVLPEDAARCRRLGDECRPLASERSPLAQAALAFIRGLLS